MSVSFKQEKDIMRIGRFELDMDMRCLLLNGDVVRLGSRAIDVLVALASARGRVVTRAELMEAAWPDVIVENCNIDVSISALRRALGADRDLIVTVARRGYRLAPSREAEAGETSAAGPVPIPRRNALFVGRETLVADVFAALKRGPVVTLTGHGGVGKSSLALEVAHGAMSVAAETVSFVDLASDVTLCDVLKSIANACGVGTIGNVATVESLTAAISTSSRLLVLDGVEHVVSIVAHVVESVLAGTARVRFLVTSREALRIRNEVVLKVPPLCVPGQADRGDRLLESPAVQLFVHHAHVAGWKLAPDASELEQIGEICRRLDGIPLAIELAAGRVEMLGVDGVRRRLGDALSLLSGGYRTATPRHRGLRAALDVSFELLSDPGQTLLMQLHKFEEPFSFESMCDAARDVRMSRDALFDSIGELVAKSLVNVCLDGNDASYSLFASTRAYAAEKLQSRFDGNVLAFQSGVERCGSQAISSQGPVLAYAS
ncbi:winged helix-turn-helix domain-containing protein [Burkholderia ubonensis]|uniref:ATP-binding protein n=1 Tax=Burkholderia ubonensis TaxID=101571 RepID=UPI00358F9A93